jgi:hypothetical protein
MDFDDETLDVDEDTPDKPDFRAVVKRSGAVRLIHWVPWLPSTGPVYTLLAARDRAGVAIADLRVVRDDEGIACEVIVKFHSGGSDVHRAALSDWARTVGYGRVWFDGEVVDLEPTAGGPVTARCTGCGQRFVDGRSGHFWRTVRCSGLFPPVCSLCGSDLPQWTPMGRVGADGTDRALVTHERSAQPGKRAQRR